MYTTSNKPETRIHDGRMRNVEERKRQYKTDV